MKNKLIFWGTLIALLSLVPITILDTVNFSLVQKFPGMVANLLVRSFGLIAFILLFWQLMIGSFMERWINKFGGWVFNFHVFNGIVIYSLAILHPLMFLVSRYIAGIGADPIFVFLGFCIYCHTKLDFYYTLGRVGFWLITVGVLAGFLRKSTPFMRFNWRKFHVLNYFAFLIIGIHGYLLGTDFLTQPFFVFSIIAYLLVLYAVVRKIPSLISTYKKWVND